MILRYFRCLSVYIYIYLSCVEFVYSYDEVILVDSVVGV